MNFLRRFTRSTRGSRARGAGPPVRRRLEELEGRALPAPLAPTGLVAAGASATAISLTWNPSADPTVTGYDVYERIWVVPPHGGKGSPGRGHYVYHLLGDNLRSASDTLGGLKIGSYHTYLVTAVGSAGPSPFSAPATAETWAAPSFPNGPNTFLLSGGALWSGPVNVTAGLTTQLTLLVRGNPLTFSVTSGPPTASINPRTGVVTYTPDRRTSGTVAITFAASNPLGSVAQTIRFHVAAPNPKLATPTLKLNARSSTYTGMYQQVSATAVGKHGATPVRGTFAIAYNGSTGYPIGADRYQVLVTFTSADPKYGNATLLTDYTIRKATPTFNDLSSPTIAVGAATTIVSGQIAVGTAVPTGDYVIMTLNGVSKEATVDANGHFSSSFATATLPAGGETITYAFAGDSNFNAAPTAVSTLTVVPLSVPKVTRDPSDRTVAEGDGVTFTVAATGSPVLNFQWQVSADGGTTFTDISSNASASTDTLVFYPTAIQNGYQYRAIVTNTAGGATSSAATLTVETDTGGPN